VLLVLRADANIRAAPDGPVLATVAGPTTVIYDPTLLPADAVSVPIAGTDTVLQGVDTGGYVWYPARLNRQPVWVANVAVEEVRTAP
jgi:hypothetical protein